MIVLNSNNNIILSIIIVTYNRSTEVIRAIESIFPLNFENYEMIIWDNNSKTEESNKIKKYCENRKENIFYHYSEINLGAGGGKNAAWLKSKGKYVFIMDDDAAIHSEHYFDKLINYMENHPEAGVTYTDIYEPSTNKHYDCIFKNNNIRCEKDEIDFNKENQYMGTISKSLAFVGGAHIIRRESIKTENLYPRYGKFGSEETYASILLWNNGYEIHKLEDIAVYHLPTLGKNIIGKDRDKILIVTAYLIKKMIYPLSLQPIVYIIFRLHLLKNGFKYDYECKKIIKTTYCKEDINRVSFKCLFKLSKLFGIRGLI